MKDISRGYGDDGSFTNREDIDFSNANELPAQQRLDLVEDDLASIDYPLQYVD